MSEIIKKSDVSEADIYGYVIDSAKKAEIEVSKLNAELRESAKLNSAVLAKNSKLSNASEIKATENAIKLANFQMKESIKLDNEKIKLEAQRINAETKLASAVDKSTRSVKDNSNAYKQMSNSARDLKNESKRLGAELDHLVSSGKKNTKEYSLLSKQYKDTTAQAVILDSKLKKLDSNVGDNQRSVGNYSKAIGGLKNGLMQLGLGFGLFQGIKSGISTISEFETSIADLSAITGATGKDLKFLENRAIDFSKAYGTSARDVAEAFKLAGSARPELLKNSDALAKITEQAIILSKASGDDLPTSISNLTGTLNAFDMPSEKAGKLIDILANASQKGAVEIPYLTEAFQKFGAVAKNAGVSVQDSAAAVEILGEKMPSAEMAGTNLRNILVILQQEASKQGRQFKGLGGELELLKPRLNDVTFLAKTFGRENLLATQVLIGQTDRLKAFSSELNVAGTAQAQANIKSKTLGEAFARLKENVNALFLGLRSGTTFLSSSLDFLSNNFDAIISVIGYATKAFIAFKIAMVAMKLNEQYTNWKNLKNVVSETGTATTEAGKSAKGFGTALKGIGFAIAIDLAFELTTGFYEMATGVDMARTAQENWNKSVKQGQKFGADVVNKLQKEIDLNKISVDEARKRVKFEIQTSNENKRLAKERIEQIQAELSITSQWTSPLRYRRLTERLNAQKNILAEENTIIKEMISFSDDLNIKTNKNTSATDKNTKAIKKNTDAKKENFKIDENKLYLDNLAELQKLTDEELAIKKAKDDEEKEMIEILSSWRIKMWEKEAQDSKDNDERIAREKAEKEAEMFKTMQDFAKLSVDYFIKKSEEKIAQIDKEIEASEKQSSILEELAKNGNITAQQSLAEQQQITNKANMEKIKEQKRIERLKLAETAFNVYGSKVEAGDKNPLVNTIKDVALLTAFIASLPAFEKGTENTGKNGQGVDGKGGFHAILHPNERVMTSEQNDLIGDISNNDVAKIVESYKMGKMVNIRPKDNAGNTFDLMPLLAEIKGLKQAINDKPTTNIELGKITQSTMQIIESTSKSNRVDRKIFNIRK